MPRILAGFDLGQPDGGVRGVGRARSLAPFGLQPSLMILKAGLRHGSEGPDIIGRLRRGEIHEDHVFVGWGLLLGFGFGDIPLP